VKRKRGRKREERESERARREREREREGKMEIEDEVLGSKRRKDGGPKSADSRKVRCSKAAIDSNPNGNQKRFAPRSFLCLPRLLEFGNRDMHSHRDATAQRRDATIFLPSVSPD
jgi:hypothetical protein